MAHVSTVAHKTSLPFMAVIANAIATFFADFALLRSGMKTYKSLNALTDQELRDIGLERFEINEVAFGRKART